MSEHFEKEMEGFKQHTPEEREVEVRKEQKKAIDRIIRGVNDVFEKDYKYEDLNLEFTIKLKAPHALEIGKIQARTSAYLGGMNNYASEFMLVVYNTLATIRVTGIDVPKFLEKDEDIYNLDILYTIGRDFQQWLNSFRL
jgi:hypothetical protein